MPWLFGLTLCLSAALLFAAQPMIAKALLPLWGGSPSVWNTCMVFFQGALLAGYGYAYATARLGARWQVLLHAGLLLVALAWLPFPDSPAAPLEENAYPALKLLGGLTTASGLPFFVVAATAPLLQSWFARAGGRDPYWLYAASNCGSLLALLAYPLAIEPNLGLKPQGMAWAAGYAGLAVLIAACAAVVWRTPVVGWAPPTIPESVMKMEMVGGAHPTKIESLARWVALAFVPSSWMLGVTTYLTTDIAPAPLLWVVPLGLYLLTFIIAFSRFAVVAQAIASRALLVLALPLGLVLGLGLAQAFWMPLHLLTFFAGALVCHGLLAHGRPDARRLTTYYLALAVGGVLGGLFNALVAPRLFDRITEYPLALVLGCLALPRVVPTIRKTIAPPRPWLAASRSSVVVGPLVVFALIALLVKNVGGINETSLVVVAEVLASGLVALAWVRGRRRPARWALTLGAALLASSLSEGLDGRTLFRERNFFGTARVTAVTTPEGEFHRLFHGNTLHGQQARPPDRRDEPLTYFHPTGPIGQVFEARQEPSNVAIVGLGAGSLASYARAGERWTFYEIDPAVVFVADDPRYFTFLADARARGVGVEIVEGDARLRLHAAPAGSFGLIVLDAFSSDAVPAHLLTREALALYRDKLAPGGLIVFNITNRYLDLEPVIAALARDAGLICRTRYDVDVSRSERAAGKQPSIWAVLAAQDASFGPITGDARWRLSTAPPGARLER